MEAGLFKPPGQLDLYSQDNAAEIFKDWQRELGIYMKASGASAKDKQVQAAIILNIAGSQVIKIVDQMGLTATEMKDPKTILKKIKEYCDGQQNEVLQSYKFWHTDIRSPFDAYLTELRRRADSCNFWRAQGSNDKR